MAAIADPTSFKTIAYPKSLARRLGLTGFGRWWLRELAAAMPVRLRTAIERRRARPVLAFDGNSATLWRPSTSGRIQMSEVARHRARWRCAGGRGDGARRARAAGARRERRAGADHRHAVAARVAAQDAHAADGARGSPASVARLRSRPAHAVQARGALLRCGHRRSRRCAQHAARRPRRGPARDSSTRFCGTPKASAPA